MFFTRKGKKRDAGKNLTEYYMHRDSVTGQMDKAFAYKEFEKHKHDKNYGGVMVHISNFENLPYYKAEEYISEVAQIAVSVADYEISRLDDGYFILFAKDCYNLADKLGGFLAEFCNPDKIYAVGAVEFSGTDCDFDKFLHKLKRRVAAAENARYIKAVRELPIYSKNT